MSILSNYDIIYILNKFGINNVKVMSKDEAYDNIHNKYFINLSNKNNEGTHWVGLCHNFYFDSYGIKPPNIIEKLTNYKYYYNDQQYQSIYKTNCGWYVVMFFLYFNKHKTNKPNYDRFLKMFK